MISKIKAPCCCDDHCEFVENSPRAILLTFLHAVFSGFFLNASEKSQSYVLRLISKDNF